MPAWLRLGSCRASKSVNSWINAATVFESAHLITDCSGYGLKCSPAKEYRWKSSVADEFNLMPPDVGLVQVDGCLPDGFIVGDVQVKGSIFCTGDLWFSWKVKGLEDVTEESLSLIDVVRPVPDLLVLGCGDQIRPVPRELMDALRRRYMSVEALDTRNAVSTYNILTSEGRKVAGAFLPMNVGDSGQKV
eukprot:jgi/Picsp_1/4931/NSC_02295-R1_protein